MGTASIELKKIEKKVASLLAKMTLEEKIGQMTQLNSPSPENEALVRRGLVGSILNIFGAEDCGRFQKIALRESRLGIPLIIGNDIIHGYHTTFPIPLAEAASWDPGWVEKSARVAAREAAASGTHWTFAPMVDIARDARWGRVAEGSGEDSYLGSRMAEARVKGFQGDDLSNPESLAACAKHYVGYGAAEGGRDYNGTEISEKTLREVYLPPFKAAVDAGCQTFMSSFQEICGLPSTANAFTLRQVLKKEWGFDGFVVSDWDSLGEMVPHGVAADRAEAALKGVLAGIDMDMPGLTYPKNLAKLVKNKKVPVAILNEAVSRILRVKFRLGLFERPLPDATHEAATLLRPDHVQTALEMARRSMVLLKNEGGLLPLKKTIKSLAVIGPLADNNHDPLGTWASKGADKDVVSVLSGIRKLLADKVPVHYARGCDIESASQDGFAEALSAASKADVVLAVVGESLGQSGEAHSRSNLDLPGQQEALLKALHATGKPMVVVLMNGRPLSIPWLDKHVPAIVEAWHLGITAGAAVAELLFGDINPSGKLPISFPRTVGQVPLYYNHRSSGRPPGGGSDLFVGYLDQPITPLYPFGHGLSYSSFGYSKLALSSKKLARKGQLKVSVELKNTGNRTGEETVQLYLQDPVASLARPVKELKGFQKVQLRAGESKKVSFTLSAQDLGFYNSAMKYVVEAGVFNVWVGGSSVSGLQGSFEVGK